MSDTECLHRCGSGACHLENGGKTGWPPGLLQDDSKGLSRWLSSKPDARQVVKNDAKDTMTTQPPAQGLPGLPYNGPWKQGDEFLPYHPKASHIGPDHRDGWNACYWACIAASQAGRAAEPVAEIGSDATLYWVGSRPVAEIFRKHGLKKGDKLYAAPPLEVREAMSEDEQTKEQKCK
ncbi:MAG: hypothetical protein V4718_04145 [Pseudomonadota bacterium]